MKSLLLLSLLFVSLGLNAQKEGDTLYSRCPVGVIDTLTGNNYFIAHQPANIKTYKAHGDFVVVIEQKNQFFTMFFHSRFKNKKKYQISLDDDGRKEMSAKYSFKSGDDVAFIDVSNGTAVTTYDKATKLWHVVLEGLIANLGDTRVTYFKAKADFYLK
jgi:hypothetical protein